LVGCVEGMRMIGAFHCSESNDIALQAQKKKGEGV
jgi:hypothetical protein